MCVMYVCMCLSVCMYVCMSVCVYVCMYVCIYICMYIYIYIILSLYIYIWPCICVDVHIFLYTHNGTDCRQ